MVNDRFQAPTTAIQSKLDELSSTLTPFQRRFADYMAIGNVKSMSEAVRQAGSKAKRPASVANKLMNNDRIVAYITQAQQSRLMGLTGSAITAVSDLIVSAKREDVRLSAANTLLDRVGMRVSESKHVHHTGNVSVNIDLG